MQRLRRWLPAVAAVSIALNLVLLGLLWRQQVYTNRYVWGGAASLVRHRVLRFANGHDPDGDMLLGILAYTQSLPGAERRFGPEDYRTIRRELQEVAWLRTRARAEKGERGELTPETRRQLDEAYRRLERMHDQLNRVNGLRRPWHGLDHSGWRAMWHDAALELLGAQ